MLDLIFDLKNSKKRSYFILFLSVLVSLFLAYFGFVTQQATIDALEIRLENTEKRLSEDLKITKDNLPELNKSVIDLMNAFESRIVSSFIYYDYFEEKVPSACALDKVEHFVLYGINDAEFEFMKLTPFKNQNFDLNKILENCGFDTFTELATTVTGKVWLLKDCDNQFCKDLK